MMRAAVLKLMDLGQKPDCDKLVKRGEVSTLKAAECRWAKIRKECLQADEVAQVSYKYIYIYIAPNTRGC